MLKILKKIIIGLLVLIVLILLITLCASFPILFLIVLITSLLLNIYMYFDKYKKV